MTNHEGIILLFILLNFTRAFIKMHLVGSDEEDTVEDGPQVEIGKVWEVLGPFSSGMREHPFIASPIHAFSPCDVDPDVDFARRPYNATDTWPSELGEGGRVGWRKFERDKEGWVQVSYPEIRWNQLRSDHGWSALQYSSILRSNITIPPIHQQETTTIRVDVIQGVEYAFIPVTGEPDLPITWYQGDIYAFADEAAGTRGVRSVEPSNFARTIALKPGKYIIIVRAIYEIRMFGDPGEQPPTVKLKVKAQVEVNQDAQLVSGLAVIPDVYRGYFMGQWIAVGLRAGQEDLVVEKVEGKGHEVIVEDVGLTHLVSALGLEVKISLLDGKRKRQLIWTPPMRFQAGSSPLRMTFASPSTPPTGPPALVSHAMIIPPSDSVPSIPPDKAPVLLALHGGGVDTEWETWLSNIPRTAGWAVSPTGRNEWGEDWHGGSMADAWAARLALPGVVSAIGLKTSEETLLVGHSNGGQGAWHLASHYPDKIIGVLAAAGYTKIQDYVPLTELTSSHHADPALMGILMSSLSPYNNDLHLSNLVHVPVLALHGGADSNVPTRHSRLQAALIDTWQEDKAAVKLIEVPGKDHWWDGMLQSSKVENWITSVSTSGKRDWDLDRKNGFTLTCFNPDECGGRAGIRIVELDIPGRMARLDVNAPHWRHEKRGEGLDLRGMNIKRVEITGWSGERSLLTKQNGLFQQDGTTANQSGPRAYGPMIRLLSSPGPLLLVVGPLSRHKSLARRLVHGVFVYHRLDAEIVSDQIALQRVVKDEIQGNVLVIGGPDENVYARWMIAQKRIPLVFPTKGIFELEERLIYEQGAGIITLHPHPTRPKALAALIAGNDDAGIEYASRLFPLRTGVPVPDWAVVAPRMAWQGAGGLIGAGFWDGQWSWSDAMSWIDR